MELKQTSINESLTSLQREHSYVFLGGLHRSGTSLLARYLAEHPSVSGFRGANVIENEGQFLQSVLPHEVEFGGVGRFGFDPRAHMSEASPLNNAASAEQLKLEWLQHWDSSKPLLLEKTPSNMLRMRLLQSFFPTSRFIIVTRHPIASALASMKWSDDNIFRLLYHWVHSYRIARADSALVDRVLWVSYEAFIGDPQRHLTNISQFLGIDPCRYREGQLEDRNAGYFDIWRSRYLGNMDRSIDQPPGPTASLSARLQKRLEREWRQLRSPLNRFKGSRRKFHDALDAVAVLEPAIQEFGYSLLDLSQTPKIASPRLELLPSDMPQTG